MLLSHLKRGQKGIIKKLADSCKGYERYRLLDLGIVPGSEIELALTNPLGDPQAYLVRSAMIALRRDQTDKIEIELMTPWD